MPHPSKNIEDVVLRMRHNVMQRLTNFLAHIFYATLTTSTYSLSFTQIDVSMFPISYIQAFLNSHLSACHAMP